MGYTLQSLNTVLTGLGRQSGASKMKSSFRRLLDHIKDPELLTQIDNRVSSIDWRRIWGVINDFLSSHSEDQRFDHILSQFLSIFTATLFSNPKRFSFDRFRILFVNLAFRFINCDSDNTELIRILSKIFQTLLSSTSILLGVGYNAIVASVLMMRYSFCLGILEHSRLLTVLKGLVRDFPFDISCFCLFKVNNKSIYQRFFTFLLKRRDFKQFFDNNKIDFNKYFFNNEFFHSNSELSTSLLLELINIVLLPTANCNDMAFISAYVLEALTPISKDFAQTVSNFLLISVPQSIRSAPRFPFFLFCAGLSPSGVIAKELLHAINNAPLPSSAKVWNLSNWVNVPLCHSNDLLFPYFVLARHLSFSDYHTKTGEPQTKTQRNQIFDYQLVNDDRLAILFMLVTQAQENDWQDIIEADYLFRRMITNVTPYTQQALTRLFKKSSTLSHFKLDVLVFRQFLQPAAAMLSNPLMIFDIQLLESCVSFVINLPVSPDLIEFFVGALDLIQSSALYLKTVIHLVKCVVHHAIRDAHFFLAVDKFKSVLCRADILYSLRLDFSMQDVKEEEKKELLVSTLLKKAVLLLLEPTAQAFDTFLDSISSVSPFISLCTVDIVIGVFKKLDLPLTLCEASVFRFYDETDFDNAGIEIFAVLIHAFMFKRCVSETVARVTEMIKILHECLLSAAGDVLTRVMQTYKRLPELNSDVMKIPKDCENSIFLFFLQHRTIFPPSVLRSIADIAAPFYKEGVPSGPIFSSLSKVDFRTHFSHNLLMAPVITKISCRKITGIMSFLRFFLSINVGVYDFRTHTLFLHDLVTMGIKTNVQSTKNIFKQRVNNILLFIDSIENWSASAFKINVVYHEKEIGSYAFGTVFRLILSVLYKYIDFGNSLLFSDKRSQYLTRYTRLIQNFSIELISELDFLDDICGLSESKRMRVYLFRFLLFNGSIDETSAILDRLDDVSMYAAFQVLHIIGNIALKPTQPGHDHTRQLLHFLKEHGLYPLCSAEGETCTVLSSLLKLFHHGDSTINSKMNLIRSKLGDAPGRTATDASITAQITAHHNAVFLACEEIIVLCARRIVGVINVELCSVVQKLFYIIFYHQFESCYIEWSSKVEDGSEQQKLNSMLTLLKNLPSFFCYPVNFIAAVSSSPAERIGLCIAAFKLFERFISLCVWNPFVVCPLVSILYRSLFSGNELSLVTRSAGIEAIESIVRFFVSNTVIADTYSASQGLVFIRDIVLSITVPMLQQHSDSSAAVLDAFRDSSFQLYRPTADLQSAYEEHITFDVSLPSIAFDVPTTIKVSTNCNIMELVSYQLMYASLIQLALMPNLDSAILYTAYAQFRNDRPLLALKGLFAFSIVHIILRPCQDTLPPEFVSAVNSVQSDSIFKQLEAHFGEDEIAMASPEDVKGVVELSRFIAKYAASLKMKSALYRALQVTVCVFGYAKGFHNVAVEFMCSALDFRIAKTNMPSIFNQFIGVFSKCLQIALHSLRQYYLTPDFERMHSVHSRLLSDLRVVVDQYSDGFFPPDVFGFVELFIPSDSIQVFKPEKKGKMVSNRVIVEQELRSYSRDLDAITKEAIAICDWEPHYRVVSQGINSEVVKSQRLLRFVAEDVANIDDLKHNTLLSTIPDHSRHLACSQFEEFFFAGSTVLDKLNERYMKGTERKTSSSKRLVNLLKLLKRFDTFQVNLPSIAARKQFLTSFVNAMVSISSTDAAKFVIEVYACKDSSLRFFDIEEREVMDPLLIGTSILKYDTRHLALTRHDHFVAEIKRCNSPPEKEGASYTCCLQVAKYHQNQYHQYVTSYSDSKVETIQSLSSLQRTSGEAIMDVRRIDMEINQLKTELFSMLTHLYRAVENFFLATIFASDKRDIETCVINAASLWFECYNRVNSPIDFGNFTADFQPVVIYERQVCLLVCRLFDVFFLRSAYASQPIMLNDCTNTTILRTHLRNSIFIEESNNFQNYVILNAGFLLPIVEKLFVNLMPVTINDLALSFTDILSSYMVAPFFNSVVFMLVSRVCATFPHMALFNINLKLLVSGFEQQQNKNSAVTDYQTVLKAIKQLMRSSTATESAYKSVKALNRFYEALVNIVYEFKNQRKHRGEAIKKRCGELIHSFNEAVQMYDFPVVTLPVSVGGKGFAKSFVNSVLDSLARTRNKHPFLQQYVPDSRSITVDVSIRRFSTSVTALSGITSPILISMDLSTPVTVNNSRSTVVSQIVKRADLQISSIVSRFMDNVNAIIPNYLKPYAIKCVGLQLAVGVIQFVDGLRSLRDLIGGSEPKESRHSREKKEKRLMKEHKSTSIVQRCARTHSNMLGLHSRYFPDEPGLDELRTRFKSIRNKYVTEVKSMKKSRRSNASSQSFAIEDLGQQHLERFNVILDNHTPTLGYYFLEESGSVEELMNMRKLFMRSYSAYCIVGHMFGLGDRHLDNVLVSKSGQVVHIDLELVFDQGMLLPVPEKVPFRLTQNIFHALNCTADEHSEFSNLMCNLFTKLLNHRQLFLFLFNEVLDIKTSMWRSVSGVHAARIALSNLRKKLFFDYLSLPDMDVVGHRVEILIQEASSTENLSHMFEGWMPFI
ncbi:hypothetical protein PCE1_002824 [Barthelona sp. PCE]